MSTEQRSHSRLQQQLCRRIVSVMVTKDHAVAQGWLLVKAFVPRRITNDEECGVEISLRDGTDREGVTAKSAELQE